MPLGAFLPRVRCPPENFICETKGRGKVVATHVHDSSFSFHCQCVRDQVGEQETLKVASHQMYVKIINTKDIF